MTWPTEKAPYASWVLLVLFVITPILAFPWSQGSFLMFPPIAAILLIPVFRTGRPNLIWAALVSLLIYALASVVWSPVFAAGWSDDFADPERQTWGKLALNLGLYAVLVTTALRMPETTQRRMRLIFMLGAVALGLVQLLEGAWGTRLFHLIANATDNAMSPDMEALNVAQGTYALALMYWPAMTLLMRRGWKLAAVMLTVSVIGAPILLHAWAPVAAVVLGGVVYGLARLLKDRAGLVLGVIVGAIVLAAPWVVLGLDAQLDQLGAQVPPSWAARLDIWRYTAEHVATQRVFGWGLGTGGAFQPIMAHPHSAPLQIWLELGVFGAALFAVVWFLITRAASKLGPQGVAAAAVYFVIGAISFGVWQEWWLGLGAMTAIWAFLARPDAEEDLWDIEA